MQYNNFTSNTNPPVQPQGSSLSNTNQHNFPLSAFAMSASSAHVPSSQLQDTRPTGSGGPQQHHTNSQYNPPSGISHQHIQAMVTSPISDDEASDAGSSPAAPPAGKKRKKEEEYNSGTGAAAGGMAAQKVKGNNGGGIIKESAKRKRAVLSCSECKRRKIKCDRKFPCSPCVLRGDQALCREVVQHSAQSTGCAQSSDLFILHQRIAALEQVLSKQGVIAPGAVDVALGHDNSSNRNEDGTIRGFMGASETKNPKDDDSGDESKITVLESLAFGRYKETANNQSETLSQPSRSYSSSVFPKGLLNEDSPLPQTPTRPLNLNDPTSVFGAFYASPQAPFFIDAIFSVLPPIDQQRVLVNYYFTSLGWFHNIFHKPSFFRELEEFWAMPIDKQKRIPVAWLSLLISILCIALHFLEEDTAISMGFTPEECAKNPEIWFTASRAALWQSDFLSNHTLEALQIIILLGVYLNNNDRADAHAALLGSGIKIAHMMGLSRLGAEDAPGSSAPPKKWTGRWENLITREVGRRIWWNLTFLDWSLAPMYSYTSSISPEQIKTAYPANIDDEKIIDGQPLEAAPIDTHTCMSYELVRLKLSEISHQIIWQMNSNPHPPYSFILSIDSQFRKAHAAFPAYFQIDPATPLMDAAHPDANKTLHWEIIISNLSLHTRVMRLHRPYLSRGYKNKKFAYSTEQCVLAATASLQLMQNTRGILEKWWIALFYSFVSATVLLIDLLHTPIAASKSDASMQKLQLVLGTLESLKQISSKSSGARGAIKVIEALLLEISNRSGVESGGSLFDESDDTASLGRAVTKLVKEHAILQSSPKTGTSIDTPSPLQNIQDFNNFSFMPSTDATSAIEGYPYYNLTAPVDPGANTFPQQDYNSDLLAAIFGMPELNWMNGATGSNAI